MKWLLSAWSGFKRLLRIALAYPLQAAIIALLCLSAWLYWSKQNVRETVAQREATIAQMEQASKDAKAAQIAMNAERTRKDTDNAKQSDSRYIAAQAAAGDATIRYIDRWRVQPNRCSGQTNSAPQGDNSEVLDAMSARTILVSERDLQACTGATTYAIEAHNHAISQIEAGVAIPVEKTRPN
jgi:hypothetical protein